VLPLEEVPDDDEPVVPAVDPLEVIPDAEDPLDDAAPLVVDAASLELPPLLLVSGVVA
jgi:hypothetical protein